MKKVLVVAPHADDELIGCGGAMLQHLKAGDDVHVAYATYGDASCPEFTQADFTERRIVEMWAAAEVMGLATENVHVLPARYPTKEYPPSLETGGFYPLRLNERMLADALLKTARAIEPGIFYLPNEADTHPDHQVVARVSKYVTRFAPGKWFREFGKGRPRFPIEAVYCYEVDTAFPAPTRVIDITAEWEQKLEALSKHSTQDVAWFERRMRARFESCRENRGPFFEAFMKM